MPDPIDNPDAHAGGADRGGDAPARAHATGTPARSPEASTRSAIAARPRPTPQPRVELCPYCGAESVNTTRCDRCAGKFDALSKQATQNAMGPWFLRDEARPHRPGCAYETIRAMAARGSITPDTVLRGPTTRQFWTRAAQTPGVAHLLGACHSCKREVDPDAFMCPACGVSFQPETDRQHLGLSALSLLPGQATPERVAAVSVPTGVARPAVPPPRLVPVAPPPSRVPQQIAALNAEWGLGSGELGVVDTPSSTVALPRRSATSVAGVVVAAFCGVVVGVAGLGGVLVWSRGGLEPALASLGMGEAASQGTVVAQRGVRDSTSPADRPPGPAASSTAQTPATTPGSPSITTGADPAQPQVASSPANWPGATPPAPVAQTPAPAQFIADVLRQGEAGAMREARALVDRFEGDGALAPEAAAAWRSALDRRDAIVDLSTMP